MTAFALPRSLAAWGTPGFAATLQRELAALDPGLLPLQQGLSASSQVLDAPHQAMLLTARASDGRIEAKVSIFFSGIVAGCNCADDPTPVAAQPEYCELLLSIDLATAKTTASLADG